MRIHRIELQAFGPFAGRETVDLEPLNEAGLFLLDGPTGAGKSTVLAAVCFALYGTLPGQRSADSLASTHASPGTRPEVLLEVTLGGRRFEILRWPRHQRPRLRRSKDGSALTEEKAGAQLRELRDGQWTEVSVRADEIGHLLRTVLPLDSEQFMHVVMLPQGEFARFLRADSKDKETLLRRLFGTGRFDHVEQHLAARHQALADAVRQDLQLTERLRAEIDEALTDHGGPDWDAAAEDAENSEDVGEPRTVPPGPMSSGSCAPGQLLNGPSGPPRQTSRQRGRKPRRHGRLWSSSRNGGPRCSRHSRGTIATPAIGQPPS